MNTTQNNLFKEKSRNNFALKPLICGYRVLRWGEDTVDGIYAKDLLSEVTLEEHIRHGEKDSPWISTTSDLTTAQVWAMNNICDVAVMAYGAMENCEIVDVRKGLPSLDRLSNNFAKSSREVCVKYHIPAEAIITVIPYSAIREMCTADYVRQSGEIYLKNYVSLLGNLESVSNSADIWKNDFAKIVKSSQRLWTSNRKAGNPLKVNF